MPQCAHVVDQPRAKLQSQCGKRANANYQNHYVVRRPQVKSLRSTMLLNAIVAEAVKPNDVKGKRIYTEGSSAARVRCERLNVRVLTACSLSTIP